MAIVYCRGEGGGVVWFVRFVCLFAWYTDINSIAVSFPQVDYFNLRFICLVFSVIYVVATPLVTEGMGRRGGGAAMTMMTSSQSGQSSQIEYMKKKSI